MMMALPPYGKLSAVQHNDSSNRKMFHEVVE